MLVPTIIKVHVVISSICLILLVICNSMLTASAAQSNSNDNNNPITGERPFPINAMGITIEILQIAYIILTTIIIVKERSSSRREAQTDN